jgi:hypothetical protein
MRTALVLSAVLTTAFTQVAPAQDAPPPKGSYTETCRNCAYGGPGHQEFICECLTRDGRYVKAVIMKYACKSVGNDDGRLVCAR